MPKVASSSISSVIIPHLERLESPKEFPYLQAEVWARAGKMRDRAEYLSQYNTTASFLISRHPLARIASAYRNKLQPDTRVEEYFINTYGRAIISAARGSWREGEPDPTFQEFVRYLIETEVEMYDEHWKPISLICRVCQLPYRYILQYENLSDDWKQLLASAEITEDLDLVWVNSSGGGDLRHYYEAISDEEIIKLFDKFESDFVMFGYTLNGYLKQWFFKHPSQLRYSTSRSDTKSVI